MTKIIFQDMVGFNMLIYNMIWCNVSAHRCVKNRIFINSWRFSI